MIAPTIVAAMPPINNHIDLSVGVPVKNRWADEANESAALIPNTIRAIPMANKANPIPLFMMLCPLFVFRLGIFLGDRDLGRRLRVGFGAVDSRRPP